MYATGLVGSYQVRDFSTGVGVSLLENGAHGVLALFRRLATNRPSPSWCSLPRHVPAWASWLKVEQSGHVAEERPCCTATVSEACYFTLYITSPKASISWSLTEVLVAEAPEVLFPWR